MNQASKTLDRLGAFVPTGRSRPVDRGLRRAFGALQSAHGSDIAGVDPTALRGRGVNLSSLPVVPSPLARSSLTSASASWFLAGEFILRTNPVSVMIAPSGPTSLIVSLESPLALLARLRCKSPISSVFKFHSVSP